MGITAKIFANVGLTALLTGTTVVPEFINRGIKLELYGKPKSDEVFYDGSSLEILLNSINDSREEIDNNRKRIEWLRGCPKDIYYENSRLRNNINSYNSSLKIYNEKVENIKTKYGSIPDKIKHLVKRYDFIEE